MDDGRPPVSVEADGRPRVLVVDDEPAARDLARRLLAEAGFAVDVAADGRAARERFEQEWPAGTGPAVVVADVVLPNEDGWTLADWLVRERPGVRVVLTSALHWGRALPPPPANVPVPLVTKPLGAAALTAAVRAALAPPGPSPEIPRP